MGFTSMDLANLDPENLDLPTTYDESEDESAGGSMARDGDDGWDGEGEEGGND